MDARHDYADLNSLVSYIVLVTSHRCPLFVLVRDAQNRTPAHKLQGACHEDMPMPNNTIDCVGLIFTGVARNAAQSIDCLDWEFTSLDYEVHRGGRFGTVVRMGSIERKLSRVPCQVFKMRRLILNSHAVDKQLLVALGHADRRTFFTVSRGQLDGVLDRFGTLESRCRIAIDDLPAMPLAFELRSIVCMASLVLISAVIHVLSTHMVGLASARARECVLWRNPADWAVSLEQLTHMESQARQLFVDKCLSVTKHDLLQELNMPLCQGHEVSHARFKNPSQQECAQAFVNHWWDELFGETVESLVSAFHFHHPFARPDLFMFVSARRQGMTEDIKVQLGGSIEHARFVKVLRPADLCAVVCNRAVDLYIRDWNLIEVLQAMRSGPVPGRLHVDGPNTFAGSSVS